MSVKKAREKKGNLYAKEGQFLKVFFGEKREDLSASKSTMLIIWIGFY